MTHHNIVLRGIDRVTTVSLYRVSKKVTRFSKLKNISGLLSDDKNGEIMEFKFKFFSNRASFMGNPVLTSHI